jgi:hypothetical protein
MVLHRTRGPAVPECSKQRVCKQVPLRDKDT